MKFSMAMLLSIIVIAALVPKFILGVFTNDAALVQAAIPTFYVILTALFFFSLMSVLFNAVLGTANTKVTLLIEVITLAFYVLYTWFIAIKLHQPVEIAWTAEWIYAFILGLLSFIYLKKGKWQYKNI